MNIFCIGKNYALHAKEMHSALPKRPVVFSKPSTALLKNGNAFYYPSFSQNIHHEVEIVIQIAKNGKCIQEKFAYKYYEFFTLGIDFTARDIQSELKSKGHPWEISKGFDQSALIGTFMNKKDISLDNIHFSLEKNGKRVQSGKTTDMLFSIDYIISYISQYFTLQRGDLIFTGTPEGVGAVHIGDSLEGFVESQPVFNCYIK